jgi:hypothetical protein
MTAFLKFTVKQVRWMPIERDATNIDHAAAQDEKIGAARSIIANVTAGYRSSPWQQNRLTATTAACITRETRCA